jgi:uncharacterized protein (TIGR00369 family)
VSEFQPADPHFEARVRESFARQGIMKLIGAELVRIAPGEVEIALPYRDDLTQQDGFFHGGVTSTIADSAGGYAAFTLFPPGIAVLTVEFKVNLLAPAAGEKLVAAGRVLRSGRTLTVSEFTVTAFVEGIARPCAQGLQTLIARGP